MDSSSRNFCIYRSKLLHYRWETGLGSPSAFLSRLTRELHAQPIRLISTPFLKINRHITRKFLIYPFDFFFFFFFTGIFSPIWLANLYDLVPARVVRLFYGRVNSQMRDLKVKGSGQLVILDDLDRLVGEQIRRVFPLHPVCRIVPAMHIVSGHILWRKRLFSSSPQTKLSFERSDEEELLIEGKIHLIRVLVIVIRDVTVVKAEERIEPPVQRGVLERVESHVPFPN